MTIKDILDGFSRDDKDVINKLSEKEERVKLEIETLLVRLNRCFTEIILPAVFDVENDLNQAGYWNQLNIGQSTSQTSGKPNIREVSLFFYPEHTESFSYDPKKIDTTYKAYITATGNLRKITFSIHFPKRIPPVVEIDDVTLKTEEIDTSRVNDFLENFIKGALDTYNSDRMLR